MKTVIKKYLKLSLLIVVVYLGLFYVFNLVNACPEYIDRMPSIDDPQLDKFKKPLTNKEYFERWGVALGLCPFAEEVW